jgi:hypothetical protein
MSTYNYKRVAIIIRTTDGREYKYVRPTVRANGTLVGDYYEYAATTALASTQAFTDFGIVKGLVTSATDWINFDIDITNNSLNYYNSEEKDVGGTNVRPTRFVLLRKSAISSIDIEEVALNKQVP